MYPPLRNKATRLPVLRRNSHNLQGAAPRAEIMRRQNEAGEKPIRRICRANACPHIPLEMERKFGTFCQKKITVEVNRMKAAIKIICLMLTGALLVPSCAASAEENSGEPGEFTTDSYVWIRQEDGSAEIVDFRGTVEELTVPSTLDGVAVTAIGDNAFGGMYKLKTVTLPESIIRIGNNPFIGCNNFERVIVPENHPYMASVFGMLYSKPDKRLISCPEKFAAPVLDIPEGTLMIGPYAFSGCSGLSVITVPESVAEIGTRAFGACSSLREVRLPAMLTAIGELLFDDCGRLPEIRIPDSVKTIGASAFRNCKELKNITIPDGVTSVGGHAFHYCGALESVSIPDSVTSVGANPFAGCDALEEIVISAGNTCLETQDGVLFTKDGSRLVRFPAYKEESEYSVPEGIKSIDAYAFEECDGLSSVKLPDSVTSIGEKAFAGCDRLSTVRLPPELTEIGKDALPQKMFSHRTAFPGADSLPEEAGSVQEFSLPDGARIYPYSGTMYTLMPVFVRTSDPEEAGYCFVKNVRYRTRADYIGGTARNTITELYICGKDGSAVLISSIVHQPPHSGVVMVGQSLDGPVADDAELWESVSGIFQDS